jgi:hypothetical protein
VFFDFLYSPIVDQWPEGAAGTEASRLCRHVIGGQHARIAQKAISGYKSRDLFSKARCKFCVDGRVDEDPVRADAGLAARAELAQNSTCVIVNSL